MDSDARLRSAIKDRLKQWSPRTPDRLLTADRSVPTSANQFGASLSRAVAPCSVADGGKRRHLEKISTPTQFPTSNVQETPAWRAIAVAAEQLATETNWFVTRFATRRKGKSQLICDEFMKRAFYL